MLLPQLDRAETFSILGSRMNAVTDLKQLPVIRREITNVCWVKYITACVHLGVTSEQIYS